MQAVTPAGRKRHTTQARHGRAWVVFALSGWGSAASWAQASSPMEQMERLMQLQRDLQQQQAQQIASLHQQMQEQTQLNAAQDWQTVVALLALLLALAAFAWLRARWPAWQAARRAAQLLAPAPHVSSRADFSSSHLGQGQSIDPSQWSGPGMIQRMLARRAKNPPTAPLHHDADSQWPEPDEDSQLLADEALREFELRRTVGLLPEAAPAMADPQSATHERALQMETAWAAMQEVPLAPADPNAASEPTSTAALLNVSNEVQRVRKSLQQRRIKRDEVRASAAQASPDFGLEGGTSLELSTSPVAESTGPQAQEELATLSIVDIEPAAAELAPKLALDITPEVTPEVTPKMAQPTPSAQAPFELNFPPSQRGLSEAEVRLALAQEFRRMGQIEEAALLCEEVLRQGGQSEQRSARLLLGSLPGH